MAQFRSAQLPIPRFSLALYFTENVWKWFTSRRDRWSTLETYLITCCIFSGGWKWWNNQPVPGRLSMERASIFYWGRAQSWPKYQVHHLPWYQWKMAGAMCSSCTWAFRRQVSLECVFVVNLHEQMIGASWHGWTEPSLQVLGQLVDEIRINTSFYL